MTSFLPDTNKTKRIRHFDVLRGLAILGILLMNIQLYSMTAAAYTNPNALGTPQWHDYLVWLFNHLVADHKFLTILTILFGVGVAMIGQRTNWDNEVFVPVHRRRMVLLMVIGGLHTTLLWQGDILFAYGLCGLLLIYFRNLSTGVLIATAAALFAVPTLISLILSFAVEQLPSGEVRELRRAYWIPSSSHLAAEMAIYRGGWIQTLAERAEMAVTAQAWTMATEKFWRTLGLMLVGVALVRHGVHTWQWNPWTAARLCVICTGVAVPLILSGVLVNEWQEWDFAFSAFLGPMVNYWASPIMAMGWAALILWMVSRGIFGWLQRRLEEIGRTALSNYLFQTLICTTLFYGHGFGWYGQLDRMEQLGVVVMVWALQMAVTHLWLQRFSTGPLEWAWRRAAQATP